MCISREVDGESVLLSQGVVVRAGICDGDWHHLAFCVPTINVRRGGSLKVCPLLSCRYTVIHMEIDWGYMYRYAMSI